MPKTCAECGAAIDRRSTICRACGRKRGAFSPDRARKAVQRRDDNRAELERLAALAKAAGLA